MASEAPIRRSTRNKTGPAQANPTPPLITTQPQMDQQKTAIQQDQAAKDSKTKKLATKKRKQPSSTPELQASDSVVVKKEHAEYWYLCPVEDCAAGYAQSRMDGPLAKHYKNEHPELHKKESWKSSLAQKVNFVKWLNEETKGNVPNFMKKNHAHLLYDSESDDYPQQPKGPVACAPVPPAPATIIFKDDLSNQPQPQPKRCKLDELLKTQKSELQAYIEQEVAAATMRAEKAEAKLERLRLEREAEKARDDEYIEELEEEIETEKNFGASTRLKSQHAAQAYAQARIELREKRATWHEKKEKFVYWSFPSQEFRY